jgi:hypothetical protein
VDAGALGHAPPTVDDHWVAGAAPDPVAQARAVARAGGGRLARVGGALLQLQRDYGNRYVQQVVQHLHQAPGPAPITRPSPTVGPIEDRYEHAAERVAQQVAGGASPRRAAGDTATGGVPSIPAVQREHGLAGTGVDDRVRQAIQGARSGGQPLPAHVRAPMERVLGADFQGVRLHTGPQADQLNRILGARAFTTGQEIFLRRGEYRPGSTAGQRLLAHELTHVAQQTGGAVNADGVSALPFGAAGAGVIQRMKIGDLDTDDVGQLAELKARISSMETLSDVEAMRSAINQQLGSKEPDDNVRQVLQRLSTVGKRLTPQQPTAPAEPGKGVLPARRERKEPSPVRTPVGDRRIPSPGRRTPAETKQPSPVVPTREERTLGRGRKREPDPASAPPELKPRGSEAGAEVLTAGARLTERSGKLLASASELAKGPGQEPGDAETWVAGAGTWLQNVKSFLQEQENWYEQDFKGLPVDTKLEYRRTLATPLLREAGVLDAHRRGLEQRFEQEEKSVSLKAATTAAIAKPKRDVAEREKLVGQYVGSLEFQLQEPSEKWKWGEGPQTVPAVLLEWIFTAAIAKVDQGKEGPSRWVAKLLKDLRALTTPGLPGLVMEVVGNTRSSGNVGGEASANFIKLNIDLSSGDLQNILTGDGPVNAKAREELVTRTASTLIHESAHVRQNQIYENSSYPWKASTWHGGFALGQLSSQGVAYGKWSEDVQRAFSEFENGGREEQAKADAAWNHIFPALERYENLATGTDERAKELVSHVMEVVYAWNDDKRFRDVFPVCAALLDRVITEGTPPVPPTLAVQDAYQEFSWGGQSNQALNDGDWKRISRALELPYDKAGPDERANILVSSLSELRRTWKNDKRFHTVFPRCTSLLAMVDIKLEW